MRIPRLAEARRLERVVQLDLDVVWNPNDDQHVLAASLDHNRAVLVLNPHMDDADDSKVVLVFDRYRYASVGGPNDEARHKHRLYRAGLASVLWAGEVMDSESVRTIDSMSASPSGSRHFIILLKDDTAEIVADSPAVLRAHGENAAIAASALAN